MHVFISSTCYDLIDLRFEVADLLRQSGLEPILSDDLDSDFKVLTGQNSIETCLENVRRSEDFVIILSSRYGPSLKKFGYGDVSATHLEYLEAVKHKKRIHMYVRDRLEADYAIWKKNKQRDDLELSWVSTGNFKIFDLLADHRGLVERQQNNWLWPFRNSVELKRRLARDFEQTFARTVANTLFKAGRIPLFEISGVQVAVDPHSRIYQLRFHNLSSAVAVNPVFKILRETGTHAFPSVPGHATENLNFGWAIEPGDIHLEWKLSYSILEGHQFEDQGRMVIKNSHKDRADLSIEKATRRYVGIDPAMLLNTEE